MNTEPVVEIRRLGIRISGKPILSEIDFSLSPGGFLSIIGPNGAGKTTLLRAIDGLLQPSDGEVLIEGKNVLSFTRKELARNLSYVPQGDPGGLDFSVREFVELGRYPHLGPWQSLGIEDLEAIRKAMEKMEIAEFSERKLGSLSGGERQRVLIAAALAQGGKILLLDEPTSFLDYRHQRQILHLLRFLHERDGYTCVMITHDLNAAAFLSDEIVVLKEGRMFGKGEREDILKTETLEEIFGLPFEGFERSGAGRNLIMPRMESR